MAMVLIAHMGMVVLNGFMAMGMVMAEDPASIEAHEILRVVPVLVVIVRIARIMAMEVVMVLAGMAVAVAVLATQQQPGAQGHGAGSDQEGGIQG